jgi:transaldolase/glucose-6-phosphate isomerase
MSNPLTELENVGQSVWFDQMERKLVSSGKLQQMIEEDDLRGLTSNPTIFDKAIAGSEDYDVQVRELAGQKRSRDDIYDELTIQDIGAAADVFRPVYDRTGGNDGFCSLEVSPNLARDTKGTVSEAKRLFARLGRPNVMIKIPATPEGLPAIEEALAAGININITLIFSNDVYRKVMEAYLRGLERRVKEGLPVDRINSVASFFVSRIDAQADKQIEARIAASTGAEEKKALEALLGKVAIANAKVAYEEFRKVFDSPRFEALRAKGAKVQRPLWASTGTKNPAYSDVLYIESLIGPETVNTVPPATYAAFKDHGKVAVTLTQGLDEAHAVLDQFLARGFSLPKITDQLTAEGVKSFDDSFASLMSTIEARRDEAMLHLSDRVMLHLGAHQPDIDTAVQALEKNKTVERIWKKDPTVWKSEEKHKKIINNALGWLTVPEEMTKVAKELTTFAESCKKEFDHVVVLGMGGSSLCSEVTRHVFERRTGWPALEILDSTVPEAVGILEARINLQRTLFIVASKSGTTTEPMMFHRFFYERVKAVKGEKAGDSFIAITDPGTQLVKDAERDHFRRIFLNQADIGGRYSALSYFGMVPAALAGIDIATLLDRATHTAHISAGATVKKNPAALLGAVMGAMAQQGRNKLTVLAEPPLDKLGLWIEQLVAESTGKEGKGIIPIALEPTLPITEYADDRLFINVRKRGVDVTEYLAGLVHAGHPVIDIVLEDPLDLGGIFFLFEFATAVAGSILGIDAFDQPNVQESKDNTKRILEEYKATGKLADTAILKLSDPGSAEAIAAHLAKVKKGDYVAFTEYIAEGPSRDARIATIRKIIARELGVATTTGYGPRFLHSTGQLHKGGPDSGVFLQLIAGDKHGDVPIPGEPFGFSVLARAQALGDYESLAKRKRRAIRIDLGTNIEEGLTKLRDVVKAAVERVRAS